MIPPPSLHSYILCDCDMVSVCGVFPFAVILSFFFLLVLFLSSVFFVLFLFVFVIYRSNSVFYICILSKQQQQQKQTIKFHRVLLILRCFLSMILVCLCVCAGSSVRKTRKRTIHTFFSFFLLLFIWLFVSFSLPTIQVSSTFNFLDSV